MLCHTWWPYIEERGGVFRTPTAHTPWISSKLVYKTVIKVAFDPPPTHPDFWGSPLNLTLQSCMCVPYQSFDLVRK
jgi:hypothetical protein